MQLKKILLAITLILVMQVLPSRAQNSAVKGRVTDASSGEPVEYANLGVVGTHYGTATDIDGRFNLDVTFVDDDKEVTISAVGYRSRVLKISQLKSSDGLTIELIPVTYDIDEVDVEAPSRILYGLLKLAVRQIPDNYLSQPYSATAVYEESGPEHQRKLNLTYTDAAGYLNRNYTDAFMSRRYRLNSGTRNFKILPFKEGLTRIEELLKFDMMRNPGNILDTAFLENFEMHERERYVEEGKHILVLAFNCVNPAYAWSGDALIRAMSGEMHVVQEDLGIIKTSVQYVSAGRSTHGRSFFLSPEMQDTDIDRIEYSVETNYASHGEKLLLGEVILKSKTFKQNETGPNEEVWSLRFKNVKPGQVDIKGFDRVYYEDASEWLER